MLWPWQRGIGRPVAVGPPVGDQKFRTTTVYIRPRQIVSTGASSYYSTHAALEQMWALPMGNAFLTAISTFGKRQVIQYAGPNNNQAAGGGLACYKVLRRYHDAGDSDPFATELQRCITNSRWNLYELADRLSNVQIPTWGGGFLVSPFANLERQGVGTHLDPIITKLYDWLNGPPNPLPSRDELDALMLVFGDANMANGAGASTLINWDPHKVLVGGQHRPAVVGLFHELVHAYYNAMGGQFGREDSLNEGNGGRLFELMAVGLGPFAPPNVNFPYSENAFRQGIGVRLRNTYP